MGLISLQWVLFGYTLAFGPSINGLIGGLRHLGLEGIGAEPNADYSTTIPALAFAAFQMTPEAVLPLSW
jgi:Amt family ammonium transporter